MSACGPGTPVEQAAAGALIQVEVALNASTDPNPPVSFEVVFVGVANGASLVVPGTTPNFEASTSPLAAPASLTLQSTIGYDECLSIALPDNFAGATTLAAGPGRIEELALEEGPCPGSESAGGVHLQVGALESGDWEAAFDASPGVDGGETSLTIKRLDASSDASVSAVTYRSVIGEQDCISLGVSATRNITIVLVAQGPDSREEVVMSNGGCDDRPPGTQAPADAQLAGDTLSLDVSDLEAGTWKFTIDPDLSGSRRAVEVTVNRAEPVIVAAGWLAVGSVATSILAAGALWVMSKFTSGRDRAKEALDLATARSTGVDALATYQANDPDWNSRLAALVLQRTVEGKESVTQFGDDMSALADILGKYLPKTRGVPVNNTKYGQDFVSAVEGRIAIDLEANPTLKFRDFANLCNEALVTLRRVSKVDANSQLAQALNALVAAVPAWYDDDRLRLAIADVSKATQQDAENDERYAVQLEVREDKMSDYVKQAESGVRNAEESLRWSRYGYGLAFVLVGLLALFLAVVSGLATQYWPKTAWGTTADIWAAATWAIASTGVVHVARLVGVGLPPIAVK